MDNKQYSPQMEVYEQFKEDASDWIFKIVAGAAIIYLVMSFVPIGLDSTDNGTDRSGMALRIDNMTGCHYLEGTNGGMTPRLYKDGTHICTGQE